MFVSKFQIASTSASAKIPTVDNILDARTLQFDNEASRIQFINIIYKDELYFKLSTIANTLTLLLSKHSSYMKLKDKIDACSFQLDSDSSCILLVDILSNHELRVKLLKIINTLTLILNEHELRMQCNNDSLCAESMDVVSNQKLCTNLIEIISTLVSLLDSDSLLTEPTRTSQLNSDLTSSCAKLIEIMNNQKLCTNLRKAINILTVLLNTNDLLRIETIFVPIRIRRHVITSEALYAELASFEKRCLNISTYSLEPTALSRNEPVTSNSSECSNSNLSKELKILLIESETIEDRVGKFLWFKLTKVISYFNVKLLSVMFLVCVVSIFLLSRGVWL